MTLRCPCSSVILLIVIIAGSNVYAAPDSKFSNLKKQLSRVTSPGEATKVSLDYTSAKTECPCSNPKWCEPITDVPDKEVFVFSMRNDESHWVRFDWSKLTTVVMFGYLNQTLMCLAHSHNVKVVLLGDIDVATFTDAGKRQLWILNQLLLVKNNFLDGLNFDFEGEVAANDSFVRDAYTSLVKEASQYFKKELPHSQISVDVAWKPNVDIRYFDYQGLAAYADILFVMAYDEQSQILGECIAGPNSALSSAAAGLDAYLNGFDKKISANKLVLGVPWYGYIYQCVNLVGDKCYIKEVPFRGVNCSDAAGTQFDYGFIFQLIETMPENYKWNASSLTPYITYTNPTSGLSYQVQFDDPQSLKLKYDLAAQSGLKGVGMWNIDSLDYSDTEIGEKIRQDMFGMLPSRTVSIQKPSMKSSEFVTCPCDNPAWCEPIKDAGRKECAVYDPAQETHCAKEKKADGSFKEMLGKLLVLNSGGGGVYAFSVSTNISEWQLYDWSKITTVCLFGAINYNLTCLAHSHNARVVISGGFDDKTLMDPDLRKKWVADQLQFVKANFLDGLNFDYEEEVSPKQKNISDAYTALVKETYTAFKQELPYSQITVDVIDDAFSKYRAYDYKGLAQYSDFFVIMVYDESGPGRVGPNSALPVASRAIDSYVKDNITANKLVLGVPWYGYFYECLVLIENYCLIKPGTGKQLSYSTIYYLLKTIPESYRWDSASCTPYLSYKDPSTKKSYQIQFDDPTSLSMKYDLATSKGIRGVGMWTIDFLDYSDTYNAWWMRQSMFGPLPSRNDTAVKQKSQTGVRHFKISTGDDAENNYQGTVLSFKPQLHHSVSSDQVKATKCPCSDPSLCQPITDTSRPEVFAFSIKNDENYWNKYDWSKITTICMFKYVNPQLMCLAHSHNVKAVVLGEVSVVTMITPALRQEWVAQQLQIVKENYLDGLNFDVEYNISPDHKDMRDAYTALVNETVTAFRSELPHTQISLDVQADAFTVSRSYNYPALAKLVDFLFIMAYDESGFDVVGPNSDVPDTITGIQHYVQEQIETDKLVLGLPWYGYIYTCARLTQDLCYLNLSFSQHAEQVDYNTIAGILETVPDKYRWNSTSESPYFSYTDVQKNISYQVQFDNPESLKIKYNLGQKLGLRGVGMWTVDFLDYTDSVRGSAMRAAMFGALPAKHDLPDVTDEKLSANQVVEIVDVTSLDISRYQETVDEKVNAPASVEEHGHFNEITNFMSQSTCPCGDAKLCEPIKETGRREVYAFSITNDENHWNKFDWSKITTVCMFKYLNASLMCLAHSHNVRAVVLGEIQKETFTEPILRKSWIAQQLKIVKDNFLDGLNFDFEGGITPKEQQIAHAYTALVKETKEAFSADLPYSQISVDVPFAPYLQDRSYDYFGLAQAADFLFIMAYDERSAITGGNVAGPNSGYLATLHGLSSFIDNSKINAEKLVLGLPWYGKVYLCVQLIDEKCIFDEKVGSKYIFYKEVFVLLETMPDKLRWNTTSLTPYITYQDIETLSIYQVHFDNPTSLQLKCDMAEKYGLRGVGIWNIDYVDYSDTQTAEQMRMDMFGTLP